MYGSQKNTLSGQYILTQIYSTENIKLVCTIVPSTHLTDKNYVRSLVDLLSCRRFWAKMI